MRRLSLRPPLHSIAHLLHRCDLIQICVLKLANVVPMSLLQTLSLIQCPVNCCYRLHISFKFSQEPIDTFINTYSYLDDLIQGLQGLDPITVIIDDTAAVWQGHTSNLVVIERYTYFPASTRQFNLHRPSMLESDR